MTSRSSAQYAGIGSAIVVGGGVAGIAAALRLAEQGVAVTLVETRKRLGGRATSFNDPTTGHTLDNCQHVLMGCCTNLLDLYQRLGVRDSIEWHSTLYFANADGHIDVLRRHPLPAPGHTALSVLGFRLLTIAEKLAVARGMMEIMAIGRRGRQAYASTTFADWLAKYEQPAGAIMKFWQPVIVSACNETIDRVAASYALQVFQDGFLCHRDAYVMGLPSVPLVQLYDASEPAIQQAGGSLMLGTSAEGFTFDGTMVTGLRIEGDRTLTADAYVSTVPFDRLDKLATDAMRAADARLADLTAMDVSPIIGVHLWYRRADGQPAMHLPHVVMPPGELDWVFNKGMDDAAGTLPTDGPRAQHVHGVISAARPLVDLPASDIAATADAELRAVFPGMKNAELIHHRVVKEKRATFALTAGIDAHRPGPVGAIPNLYLAGDWTDAGWPATMEGAVRTGYRAAAAALRREPDSMLIADLPPAPMYRLMEFLLRG
jgi:zeta-carotene desaturase